MNPILLPQNSTCRFSGKRRRSWPAWVLGLALLAGSFSLNSCGTARGFGSDVERAGDKIQDAATR
ncbi:entericidin A/B family lipoprotein [Luteolibacter rhizosphaerae]|uniref:entericidin A/B family lipoprotein n=1 Tax=Luteolibacter rhizosphaerae TaxID=2989719 RepID=UPI0031F2DC88